MAALSSASSGLAAALGGLRQRWLDTEAVWSDSVSHDFAKDYLAPLQAQAKATLDTMQSLAQVVAAARQRVR